MTANKQQVEMQISMELGNWLLSHCPREQLVFISEITGLTIAQLRIGPSLKSVYFYCYLITYNYLKTPKNTTITLFSILPLFIAISANKFLLALHWVRRPYLSKRLQTIPKLVGIRCGSWGSPNTCRSTRYVHAHMIYPFDNIPLHTDKPPGST